MSPETVGHLEAKVAIFDALRAGIRVRGLDCYVLPEGRLTVRIDETTAYEADALVYCGQKLPPTAIEIPNPLVLVEVLSPSSRKIDTTLKLAGYFRLPSVAHYLIVDPKERSVIHHSRDEGQTILTRIVTEGVINLDPPGLSLAIADIYSGQD